MGQPSARFDPGARPGAYLTSAVPGLSGRLRDEPEDFLVDEVPLYLPSGEGEHLYLRIEKRDMATSFAADLLARALRVRVRDIASAGLKDRRAVTTQWVSVHDPQRRLAVAPGEVRPGLRILEVGRHANKLRRGHLAANRFTITIRGGRPDAEAARAALDILARRGVPNRAGEQRFGMRENNHLLGRALLLGDHEALLEEFLAPDDAHARVDDVARRLYAAGRYDDALDAFPRAARAERAALAALARGRSPADACRAVEPGQRAFWLTALQSAIFNHVLDDRLERSTLDALEVGDVAMLFGAGRSGPTFLVTDADARDPDTLARVERMEVTATGPLWGPRMQRAGGEVDRRERAALAGFGLTLDHLDAFTQREGVALMPGARRPLRALLRDPHAEAGADERGEFVRCRFTLSPGAFATIVMDEIMKPGAAPAAPRPAARSAPDGPVRLVCFDLGGVLVRICRSWEEGCAAAGVDLRAGWRPDEAGEARRLGAVDELQRGLITRERFWSIVSETFRGVYSPDEVARVHRAWLLGEYADIGALIDRLHARAVATACLSNTNEPHWEDLLAYDALRRLQARYASHEMGLAKPDEAIYRAFERAIGASGPEILFFEDTPENARAAANLGWRTHLVDPSNETAPQIEAALRAHAVL